MIEIWKIIPGYNYQISNLGNVKNVKGKLLKLGKETCGYLGITLVSNKKKKRFRIHRLVASAFIPNPNNLPQVNHIDTNKENNIFTNLEWCTPSQNLSHAAWNGLRKIGEDHEGTKLSNVEALNIYNSPLSLKDLADKYQVSRVLIGRIKNGKTWKQITKAPNKKTRVSNIDIITIFKSLDSTKDLAIKYGLNNETIRLIRKGRTWKHLTKDL